MFTITSGRGTYSYSWQVINKKLKSFKIILSVISLVYRLTVYFLLDTKNDNHKTYLQYPVISRFEQCIKAFKSHWFNKQHNLKAVKADLAELFQWCCHHKAVIWEKLAVYEYVNDGVAMDSPLGLLYDNWRIPVNSPRRIRNTKARFLNSTNALKYHNGLNAQCWKVWNHSQSTPIYTYPSPSILAKKVV